MDIDSWLEGLRNGRILTEREVKQLCLKITEILCEVIILNSRNQTFNQ